jgi:hypothetical protein
VEILKSDTNLYMYIHALNCHGKMKLVSPCNCTAKVRIRHCAIELGIIRNNYNILCCFSRELVLDKRQGALIDNDLLDVLLYVSLATQNHVLRARKQKPHLMSFKHEP